MTAPTLAEVIWYSKHVTSSTKPEFAAQEVQLVIDALAATTADRDDARRELAEQKQINTSNLRVVTEQLELARQTIADAPHGAYCVEFEATWRNGGDPCTCWKATL
jgi:hypothetical protein